MLEVPYGIVYMTSRVFRGEVVKRYIGQHKVRGVVEDGYLGSGNLLLRAVRKYGRDVFTRETLEVCYSAKELFAAEEKWVKAHDAVRNQDFYNLAEGGNATIDKFKRVVYKYDIAGEFIEKFESIAEAAKRLCIREGCLHSALDHDHRSSGGYRWTSKNRKLPPLHNKRWRAILCFDTGGKFVQKFTSSVGAAIFAVGTAKSNITACCKRRIKTAGGYQWRYAEDSADVGPITIQRKPGSCVPVQQICKASGKVLHTFKNFQAAALHNGCNRNSIRLAVGTGQTCKGFRWVKESR